MIGFLTSLCWSLPFTFVLVDFLQSLLHFIVWFVFVIATFPHLPPYSLFVCVSVLGHHIFVFFSLGSRCSYGDRLSNLTPIKVSYTIDWYSNPLYHHTLLGFVTMVRSGENGSTPEHFRDDGEYATRHNLWVHRQEIRATFTRLETRLDDTFEELRQQ